MDDKSKEMLDEILAKEPAALTDSDKAFLRARRSYLNGEQQAVYAEVLEQTFEPEPEVEESQEAESTEKIVEAPKRGRKAKEE